MSFKKSFKVLIVFIGIIVLSSCSKEKAEAVQLAAEQFRVDAVLALEQMNYLFNQDISMTEMSTDDQIKFVLAVLNDSTTVFDSELISGIEMVTTPNDEADTIEDKFTELKAQYYQFEKMFSSLDKGSYFAKDAVKEAEKHAINLTIQLINYAELIQKGGFTFTAARATLLTKMQLANEEKNIELQKELYKNLSVEVIQLLNAEKNAQEGAIRLCYKAAESGKVVTELVRNYDEMSFGDIMNSIKGGLSFAMEITNGNEKISDLAMKFEGFENTIREDEHYDDLLDKKVITSKK